MKIEQSNSNKLGGGSRRSVLAGSSFRRLVTRIALVTWGASVSFLGYILVKYSNTLLTQNIDTKVTLPSTLSSSSSSSANAETLYVSTSTDTASTSSVGGKRDKNNNKDARKWWNLPRTLEHELVREDPLCRRFNHSILTPDHGCEVNTDTLTVFCNFNNLRIDNTKIELTDGGEQLKDVMGRSEDVELPKYTRGAFTVPIKPNYNVPTQYRSGLHYIENVLNALKYPRGRPSKTTTKNVDNMIDTTTCHATFEGYTLFITRYEYVNWYHTLTDLWNSYFVLPGGRNKFKDKGHDSLKAEYVTKPHQVVFLDGHAQGGLDSIWKTLFGDFHYIQHLPKGGVCFDRAIFVPAGYKSPLFTDMDRQRCPDKRMGQAFSNFVLNRFNIDPQKVVPQRGRILLIDRQHYVSHPRSNPDNHHQIIRQITNLSDVKKMLKKKVPGVTQIDLVRLETLDTFEDQIRMIRQAHVVVGMHGAALSHLMFMDGKYETEQRRLKQQKEKVQPSRLFGGGNANEDVVRPTVVEITIDYHDFFEEMAKWRGVQHELIEVKLSNSGELGMYAVQQLIDTVNKVMR
jgi:Glycosyltransferase 61